MQRKVQTLSDMNTSTSNLDGGGNLKGSPSCDNPRRCVLRAESSQLNQDCTAFNRSFELKRTHSGLILENLSNSQQSVNGSFHVLALDEMQAASFSNLDEYKRKFSNST